MSLENEIKKLREAIEENTKAINESAILTVGGVDDGPVIPEETPVPPATPEETPAPPAPPATPEAPPAPKEETVAPPAPVATVTAEELNAALLVEFNRLGNRERIDAVIKELGGTGISDLTAEQYPTLLEKVRAL